MAELPAEYRHEPRLALAGGADGLDLVARMLAEAPAHLEPDGLLVCEIGDGRRPCERAFPRLRLELGEGPRCSASGATRSPHPPVWPALLEARPTRSKAEPMSSRSRRASHSRTRPSPGGRPAERRARHRYVVQLAKGVLQRGQPAEVGQHRLVREAPAKKSQP